eukprot:m.123731 g.123731  ORF g.123731 m.123731 type:complete len:116 (-) comp15576_c0_seq9:1029-1376(-)
MKSHYETDMRKLIAEAATLNAQHKVFRQRHDQLQHEHVTLSKKMTEVQTAYQRSIQDNVEAQAQIRSLQELLKSKEQDAKIMHDDLNATTQENDAYKQKLQVGCLLEHRFVWCMI